LSDIQNYELHYILLPLTRISLKVDEFNIVLDGNCDVMP